MPVFLIHPIGFFFTQSCDRIWKEAYEGMAPTPGQPKAEAKSNVARMAKAHRLNPYNDLSLISNYAAKFGLDPDWVYDHTSFGTIISFATMWKESDEYVNLNLRISSIVIYL